jgi:hypothetical protein
LHSNSPDRPARYLKKQSSAVRFAENCGKSPLHFYAYALRALGWAFLRTIEKGERTWMRCNG